MIHHVGLEVESIERSSQFYQRWFQLSEKEQMTWNGEKILFLLAGSICLELIEVASPNHQNSDFHLAFEVIDLEKHIFMMEQEGVEILEPIQQGANGWKNAFVAGPDGEWIELIQLYVKL